MITALPRGERKFGTPELVGGVVALGLVGLVYAGSRASAAAPGGTSVTFASANPTSVAAVASAQASDYATLSSAITARSQIGATLLANLVALENNGKANQLAYNASVMQTKANTKVALGAQATSLGIASLADQTTEYGAATGAQVAEYGAQQATNQAGILSGASVQIAGVQAAAQEAIATTQGAAQQAASAAQVAAVKAAQPSTLSTIFGGITGLAKTVLPFFDPGAATQTQLYPGAVGPSAPGLTGGGV